MAKKRAKILETKYFGLIIGLFIVLLFLGIDLTTNVFDRLNVKAVDIHFFLKSLVTARTIQEGVSLTEANPKISDDLVIIGIDAQSLGAFGKWPFPRSVHANLIDSFARISNQANRESALFLDVFMIEPDGKPADDARLVRSIRESGHVFMETVLDPGKNDYESYDIMVSRQELLAERFGGFKQISGPWQAVETFKGVQAPIKPYVNAIVGYGHANYTQDIDEVYRRQALVAKFSQEVEQIRFDSLTAGFDVDAANFERLAWTDARGFDHPIGTPLSAESIARLGKQLAAEAPPVIIDENGDGKAEDTYFIVRKFRDQFIPSITMALAMNYFGVSINDVKVEFGKSITINNPTILDQATGQRIPYSIPKGQSVYDAAGNLLKEAKREYLPRIEIPIDDQGAMMINFMGYRSSSAVDGYQTFKVRSYATYAEKVPGISQDDWPSTKAVGGKILMVGAFADGIAQDEKPTPYGLMYGIEIHTNALNTILMNNFLHEVAWWVNLLILFFAVMIIALLSARFSSLLSFFVTLFGMAVLFLTMTFLFEYNALIIDYPMPAIGMFFAFISVVSYRAMTEERDKKALKASFSKYVSPAVVDQMLDNPPELGGVDKELTVLFSDIRGFTTLSENMTPQELVNHLNEYLTAMTNIIMDYFGTLDKYVGDEVMCFWGAPLPQQDHAILACKCALRQMERLRELNAEWPPAKRINIGIGLNSGIMTVGNMGSPGRLNYTLMGDNVNLGARLEGTNKMYGTNIIVSEFTYGLVKDHFVFRELDNIRVKGKNKPVLIFELVDCLDSMDPPAPDEKRKKT
jgi:adenylate cyclase